MYETHENEIEGNNTNQILTKQIYKKMKSNK